MVTAAVCQSCAMPLEKPEDFGTNAGGSKNDEFCTHCYQEGAYTAPNTTIDEMAEIVAGFMDKPNKDAAHASLSDLKRWQGS